MKLLLNLSITVKLLLVNILILAVVGGIISVAWVSFIKIQDSLTKIINDDVNQVIENAQIGRELNRAFTATNLLINTIYEEDKEHFAKESQDITETVNTLIGENSDEQLQTSLRQFSQQLQVLFEDSANIQHHSQNLQTLDRELSSELDALEELIAEKLIVLAMEGKDTSSINQISSLIPGFREALLQISLQTAEMKQEHSAIHTDKESAEFQDAEKMHPTLVVLLEDLSLRFRTLIASEEEVATHGQKLIDGIGKYQDMIVMFHHILEQFKTHTVTVRETQYQVLSIMAEIDDGKIRQTTAKIRQDVAEIIGQSRNIILALTAVMFGVLILGLVVTRWMTRPLENLSLSAIRLADGDIINCDVQDVKSRDEIGALSRAFKKLMLYFKEMASTATEISHGKLDLEIRPRSKNDVFGTRFQQMIAYLKNIGDVAVHISQGDLRSQVDLQSQDDQLGSAFIHMQKGLITLISGIRSAADYLSSISTQMLGSSAKNSEALTQIGNAAEVTSSAMQEMSSSAAEVRLNIEHLSSSVEETSASIRQMIASIKHIAENSKELSGIAADTSTTIGTIVQSLEQVTDQTHRSKILSEAAAQDAVSGQASMEQMMTKISTISDVTENISNIVLRLENRSKEIDTILEVINEVAEQTSLLSLNASIIAAQAGVHGRGFAVVADEIKELAIRVGTSAKDIAQIVKSVQRDSSDAAHAIEQGQREVGDGVNVARETKEALNKIGQSAQNSSEVVAEIAVVVRQQTTASTHIAESIRDETNMINEITRATAEQEKNSVQLLDTVENMQDLVAEVLRATKEQQENTFHVTEFMEEVTNQVDQSTPTVKQLAQSANELASQADTLNKQVERFIIPNNSKLDA